MQQQQRVLCINSWVIWYRKSQIISLLSRQLILIYIILHVLKIFQIIQSQTNICVCSNVIMLQPISIQYITKTRKLIGIQSLWSISPLSFY